MTSYLGSSSYKSWKLTKIMPNSLKLFNHYILSNTPQKIRQWALNLSWKTYHYSTKSALKYIADELQINILKPTQDRGTRWLPHVSWTLNVFVGSAKSISVSEPGQYSTVLMHMENQSVN